MKRKAGIKANVAKCGQSKSTNMMHAHELARCFKPQGLALVSLFPDRATTQSSTSCSGSIPPNLILVMVAAVFWRPNEIMPGVDPRG